MNDDEILNFVVCGDPVVQKNNLEIHKIKRGNKLLSFIDHSGKMKKRRDEITVEIYKQFKKQGKCEVIDFLFSMDIKFYCNKKSEPDLDNLPSIILDAMLGISVKTGGKKNKIAAVISDDKLLRMLTMEKIIEGDQKYHGKPRTEFSISKY